MDEYQAKLMSFINENDANKNQRIIPLPGLYLEKLGVAISILSLISVGILRLRSCFERKCFFFYTGL